MQVNANGETLHSEIQGILKMKTHLSGMPELKLGLNDKILFENTGKSVSRGVRVPSSSACRARVPEMCVARASLRCVPRSTSSRELRVPGSVQWGR